MYIRTYILLTFKYSGSIFVSGRARGSDGIKDGPCIPLK